VTVPRARGTAALALAVLAALAPLAGACRGDGGPTEPATPRRVVVLAPALAEMLDALDLADRVVGVGRFGPWPDSLDGKPVVGGYDAPNLERALELGADLVLTSDSRAADAAHERLGRLGVRVAALDTDTLDGVFHALERVGELFGRPERAAAIARTMRDELRAIERRAAELPPRRVLVVVGRDPLYVAGPGSHLDAMIRAAGGRNVAADAGAPYARLAVEAALEREPEVIVDMSDNRPEALRGRVTGPWQRWTFLPAVRDGRVYHVDPGRLAIPGLRLPEMTRLMARLVHPEAFGEPDLGAGAG